MEPTKVKSEKSIRNKMLKWGIALVAVVIFVSNGYSFWQQHQGSENTSTLPSVTADTRILAEGVVAPTKISALNFAIPGLVSEILVAEGEEVQAGQTLARLDSQDVQARYEQAVATLAKSRASKNQQLVLKQAELARLQPGYEVSKADYERVKKLYESGANTKQELDQSESRYLQASAELQGANDSLRLLETVATSTAEAEVAEAQANVKYYEHQLAQTELRAPFAGIISFINFNVGEYITIGSTNLTESGISPNSSVQLADLSKWCVKTDDLTELNANNVKPGAQATVKFDAIPGLEMTGKILSIRPFGEKRRGDMTYTVTIELDGKDDRLRWNMRASVAIENG